VPILPVGDAPAPDCGVTRGPELYLLSVNPFDRMVAIGVLAENDRVELLEGALIARRTTALAFRQSGL
jgi:hypothetical protein